MNRRALGNVDWAKTVHAAAVRAMSWLAILIGSEAKILQFETHLN